MSAVAVEKTQCSKLLPPSLAELEKNEARCRQILECKKQIKVWQDRLDLLLAEQARCGMITKLRLDAVNNWELLSPEDRLDKSYILAALASEKLPESLQSFGEDEFPFHIRTDRDIFIARLRHRHFELDFLYDASLFVPPVLCDDKDIMMEVVRRQPLVIQTMPDIWRDDKDIVRSVLRHPNIPADVLEYFSEAIRSDAELMIEVFQHPKSEFSWIRHCSESLRDNKRFLTSVVEGAHHVHKEESEVFAYDAYLRNLILQYASQRLQNDFEFVMACVQQSGMNLKYAGKELRGSEAIVVAACLQDGYAFQYCTSATIEQDLLEYRKFAESILCCASAGALQLYLENYGEDESFLLRSLMNRRLKWSMIPMHWRSNVDFLALGVQQCYCRLWWLLPVEMKRSFIVASKLSRVQSLDRDILADAIESCPEMLSDRHVMKDFFSNSYDSCDALMPRILEISKIDIQNDKDFMLEAINKHPLYWNHCSERLQDDEDILFAVAGDLYCSELMLKELNQLEHPNVVARVLKERKNGGREMLYGRISSVLWFNRDVAMAWLSIGGRWLESDFSQRFREDEELVLTAIKHHWDAFSEVSDALKQDKAFVLKALAIDARIIQDADDSIFFDDEMVLEAISRDVRVIEFYVEDSDACFSFIISFARKIRKRLREYQTFQDEFIASITKSPKETTCLLPMLNQGPVMLRTYENKIASYAGILLRDGDELARYELASTHLAQWGI